MARKLKLPCVGVEGVPARSERTGRNSHRIVHWRLYLYAKSLPVCRDVVLGHVRTGHGCPKYMMEDGKRLAEELNIPFMGIVELDWSEGDSDDNCGGC